MAKKKKQMDKLAWENAQALAAGMSYGKWKAMQDPVRIEKKTPEGWTKCKHCGELFEPKKGKIYCDDYCRYMGTRERYKEANRLSHQRRRERLKEGATNE